MFIAFVILYIVIFSINTKSLLKIDNRFGAYIGIKYTVLLLLILNSLNATNYIFSISCLIISVISIICGFMLQNKSIRLYGLILSMISIAKLILIDITYDNTLMRAVSFLICGLLCFGISLIYNYIDKKQNTIEKNENIN